MTLRRVSIHGHDAAFRVAGHGPVLLLLHGMAASSQTWAAVTSSLARRFTVVAPDLLGHGESGGPHGEYSLGAHANFIRDLLATLGYARASVVGHSFGGGVAMQLAYQYPDRCERLVLVGSGGLGREVNGLLRMLALPGAEQLFPLVCSSKLRAAGERVGAWLAGRGLRAAPALEEVWRSYALLAEAGTRCAFFRTLRAVIDSEGQSVSASDRLRLAAHMPTLIVWGGRDTIIPVRHGRSAHDAIANSRLEVFEAAGHYPHCEEPERFVEALTEFVESTMPARHCERSWHALLRHGASVAPEAATA